MVGALPNLDALIALDIFPQRRNATAATARTIAPAATPTPILTPLEVLDEPLAGGEEPDVELVVADGTIVLVVEDVLLLLPLLLRVAAADEDVDKDDVEIVELGFANVCGLPMIVIVYGVPVKV